MTGAVPSALGGGLASVFIAVFSYIPATTPPDLSTIRFMFAEVLLWLASPLATMTGGFLLNYNIDRPMGGNGQLLNYQAVFITSASLTIVAFFWSIFFVNEERDRHNLERFSNDPATIYQLIQRAQHKRQPNRPLHSILEERKAGNPFKLLFNWGILKFIYDVLAYLVEMIKFKL